MSYEPIDDGRTIIVRKKTYCEWCGESISKGEKAINRVYKFNSDFNHGRQHPECYKAMNRAYGNNEMYDDGFSPEMPRGQTHDERENGKYIKTHLTKEELKQA